jgi:hypothetical protein
MSCQVRIGHVRSGQVMSGHVMSGQDRSGHVRSGQIRSELTRQQKNPQLSFYIVERKGEKRRESLTE